MSDAPPQLGEIPQQSELNVPTIKTQHDANASTNGSGGYNPPTTYQNAKEGLYNSEVSIRLSRRQIIHIHDGTDTDFPLACPPALA